MFYIFIWFLLIVMGFLFHDSKRITYCQMLFSILLMGLNSNTADYHIYNDLYYEIMNNHISIFNSNWLFKLFFNIVGKFTSVQCVIFCIALVGIILIYKSVQFYTKSTALVFSLYLIAPFVIDATQLKNFLAMSVWLYFSRYLFLIYEDKGHWKENLGKYLIGVVLSGSIHLAFFSTIIFAAVPFISNRRLIFTTIGLNIIVVLISASNIIELIMNKVSLLDSGLANAIVFKYKAYNLKYDSEQVKLRILLLLLGLVFFLLMYCFTLVRNKHMVSVNNRHLKQLDFVLRINNLMMLMIPLLFFSVEFYRMQRNILVINYAVIVNFISESKLLQYKIKPYSFVLEILCFVLAFFYLYIDAIHWNSTTVFLPLFQM